MQNQNNLDLKNISVLVDYQIHNAMSQLFHLVEITPLIIFKQVLSALQTRQTELFLAKFPIPIKHEIMGETNADKM